MRNRRAQPFQWLIISVAALSFGFAALAETETAETAAAAETASAETEKAGGEATNAPSPSPEQTPEQTKALKDRVGARWAALVKRDFPAVYEFETPEYRKAHTQEQFASQFGPMARWHLATVQEVSYARPGEADVAILLEYSIPVGDGWARTTGKFKEHWSLIDGQWWRNQPARPLARPLGGNDRSEPSLEQ